MSEPKLKISQALMASPKKTLEFADFILDQSDSELVSVDPANNRVTYVLKKDREEYEAALAAKRIEEAVQTRPAPEINAEELTDHFGNVIGYYVRERGMVTFTTAVAFVNGDEINLGEEFPSASHVLHSEDARKEIETLKQVLKEERENGRELTRRLAADRDARAERVDELIKINDELRSYRCHEANNELRQLKDEAQGLRAALRDTNRKAKGKETVLSDTRIQFHNAKRDLNRAAAEIKTLDEEVRALKDKAIKRKANVTIDENTRSVTFRKGGGSGTYERDESKETHEDFINRVQYGRAWLNPQWKEKDTVIECMGVENSELRDQVRRGTAENAELRLKVQDLTPIKILPADEIQGLTVVLKHGRFTGKWGYVLRTRYGRHGAEFLIRVEVTDETHWFARADFTIPGVGQ